jgi:D-glycero-D-manno-heptose 1,7-bisphosphate phosphatase
LKAVILAGGVGSRLLPLTRVMPKALAPIHGTPIIKQQIDLLISVGIKEIMVLCGYRGNMIERYLNTIFFPNTNIRCFRTPDSFSPAQRLLFYRNEIGDDFLLLYCDNLVNDLDSIENVMKSKKPITFLLEKRNSGNISSEKSAKYFLVRSSDSPFVDLGYMHIYGSEFFAKLNESESLTQTLHDISKKHDLFGILSKKPLQSVSNISNFTKLRENRKTILLDRDGIINVKMPHREYVDTWEKFKFMENNLKSLSENFSKSTDFIIVTNQPGVALKQVEANFLDSLHSMMVVDLLAREIPIIGLYVCVHHWDEGCLCRKPKPGMLLQAISDYELNPIKLVYIGDEKKDVEAAQAAGINGLRITSNPIEGAFRNIDDAYLTINELTS